MLSSHGLTGLSRWLGLVAAVLALGVYRIGFGALGVVLDTRPAAAALAIVSVILTVFGLRRRESERAGDARRQGDRASHARRATGMAALAIAVAAAGLVVADHYRVGRSEEVSFLSGRLALAGTLHLPRAGAPPWPAVVITHGAGEETRHEGAYYARLFARHGIAALAYDKRGSGMSGGDLTDTVYQDLAGDALAAVRYLAGRREIDARRIGLWGVSEGGWIVPIAAAAAPGDVAFAIVVSTTAESPADQVRYEVGERVRRAGYDAETAARAAALYARVSDFERTGQDYDGLAEQIRLASREGWFDAAGYLPGEVVPFERLTRLRWYPAWRANMDFDAPSVWQRVRCPVLVLLGGSDPKIDAAKAASRIPEALAQGGNTEVTVRILPRAEHGLAVWWLPGRLPPPRFPEGYPDLMVDWVIKLLARSHAAGASGDFEAPARLLHEQSDPPAQAGQHVDQGIGAEQVNPAAEQIADPRLGDAQDLGRLCLSQAAGPDDLLDMKHQGGADAEVLGPLRGEAQVPENVPCRGRDLHFHGLRPSLRWRTQIPSEKLAM